MNIENTYKCNIIKTPKRSITPTNILSDLFLKDYKILDIIKCYPEDKSIVIDITSTNENIISLIKNLDFSRYEINSIIDISNIIEYSPEFQNESYARLLFSYINKN